MTSRKVASTDAEGPSIGTVDDGCGNMLAQTTAALFKTECIDDSPFAADR
jgi:hypothetical protein